MCSLIDRMRIWILLSSELLSTFFLVRELSNTDLSKLQAYLLSKMEDVIGSSELEMVIPKTLLSRRTSCSQLEKKVSIFFSCCFLSVNQRSIKDGFVDFLWRDGNLQGFDLLICLKEMLAFDQHLRSWAKLRLRLSEWTRSIYLMASHCLEFVWCEYESFDWHQDPLDRFRFQFSTRFSSLNEGNFDYNNRS